MSSQTGCVDGQCDSHQQHSGNDASKRTQKRKRDFSVPITMTAEQKQARIHALRQELDCLFAYYREVMTPKLVLDFNHCSSTNALIACFMEESHLPLSRLVTQIYDNLKDAQNAFLREPVTPASIKTSVLYVGQRFMYGVPNADADVLEDDSESCLWCWETRDIRLLPKPLRGDFNVRRICRKRIHDRIAAVSAMVSALQKSGGENNCKYDLITATEKLDKAFCVEDIRSLVDQLFQQKCADMAEKETKRQEKLLVRQMEKSKREAAKEKRISNELKMEKSQIMEQEKHNEMELSEMRKQSQKQLEESEKHQRRLEREKVELKRKLSLQKQVSIMERFLKIAKSSDSCTHDQCPNKASNFGSSEKENQNASEAATQFIDSALTSKVGINDEDILKSHMSSWHSLAQCIQLNREQHWGLRRKPKTELFKELKLSDTKEYIGGDDTHSEKLVDGWPEPIMADKPCLTQADNSFNTKVHYRRKQLLQFHNSPRPAFYGIWPKKSNIVGARHPFRKDPDLDYDIDSDEEWEEEESGESLSDCEIEEEENLEGCSKSDNEDDTEDGFFVPDGYLSENEGAQVDGIKKEIDIEVAQSSPDCEHDTEDGEFCALLLQEKYLNNLTEHALRKNQPFVILDFMHDKASLLIAPSTIDTLKLEEKCLQALRMCALPGYSTVGLPGDDMEKVDESPSSLSKVCTSILDMTSASESELSTVVSAIQTCSQGMSKVLDCLQKKFPSVPKSLLKNKVREISYFADNHWQVKKEVLDKLGLAGSPEKRSGEARSISTFFSKRCLPPTGERC